MVKYFFFFFSLSLFEVNAQSNVAYLKANAVRMDDAEQLSDSVYHLLTPFQVFMFGEMHGTNESAPFIIGLANLLASKGDTVSVGLEIPSSQMTNFISARTDSSIYQSNFFSNLPYADGRESFAWASIISHLKNNSRIQLFFYDINTEEEKKYDRDSLMYLNIKKQIDLHPNWKVVALCGNSHANISPDEKKMAWYLKKDKELNLAQKLCSIYHYYLQGSCMNDFGNGYQETPVGRPVNDFDTTFSFDKYFVLLSAKTTFTYTAIYYTKTVTPSLPVKNNLDLPAIKKELKAIYERDQKTRKSGDSAAFAGYIDSSNQVQIKSLIAKYGWMGKSLIGNYNQVLFLVIQHADSAIQEKYFPQLQQSVDEGESSALDLAMMQDRILMRRGVNQIYGSQVVSDGNGDWKFYPIEDEKNVNTRRAKIGLQPIEEYAKYFSIEYKPPTQ